MDDYPTIEVHLTTPPLVWVVVVSKPSPPWNLVSL
jgi:hypothetical protein